MQHEMAIGQRYPEAAMKMLGPQGAAALLGATGPALGDSGEEGAGPYWHWYFMLESL